MSPSAQDEQGREGARVARAVGVGPVGREARAGQRHDARLFRGCRGQDGDETGGNARAYRFKSPTPASTPARPTDRPSGSTAATPTPATDAAERRPGPSARRRPREDPRDPSPEPTTESDPRRQEDALVAGIARRPQRRHPGARDRRARFGPPCAPAAFLLRRATPARGTRGVAAHPPRSRPARCPNTEETTPRR